MLTMEDQSVKTAKSISRIFERAVYFREAPWVVFLNIMLEEFKYNSMLGWVLSKLNEYSPVVRYQPTSKRKIQWLMTNLAQFDSISPGTVKSLLRPYFEQATKQEHQDFLSIHPYCTCRFYTPPIRKIFQMSKPKSLMDATLYLQEQGFKYDGTIGQGEKKEDHHAILRVHSNQTYTIDFFDEFVSFEDYFGIPEYSFVDGKLKEESPFTKLHIYHDPPSIDLDYNSRAVIKQWRKDMTALKIELNLTEEEEEDCPYNHLIRLVKKYLKDPDHPNHIVTKNLCDVPIPAAKAIYNEKRFKYKLGDDIDDKLFYQLASDTYHEIMSRCT